MKFAQGFKDWGEVQRTVYQKLDNLTNLLINVTVKARADKDGYLPNDVPNNIPNDADTWKSHSSLYPVIKEDQFQSHWKKNWWVIRGSKINPTMATKY